MIENVNAVFWKDVEPVTFPDQPDVMDDLGLKKQRKQMTAEQNRMIKLKHDIQCFLEGTLALDPDGEQLHDPFDFDQSKVPDTTQRRIEMMKSALVLSALRNPQYRNQAAEYLEAAIPAVTKRRQELQQKLQDLQTKLESIQSDYLSKISEARKELNTFQADVKKVADRFYLTDTGSAKQGGLVPCELPDPALWTARSVMRDQNADEYMLYILDCIHEIERSKDSPEIVATYTTHFRDGSGRSAQTGGVISEGGATSNGSDEGLRGMLKNLFIR